MSLVPKHNAVGEQDSHASHSQYWNNGELGRPPDLEIPEEESGQYSKCKVRDDTERTVKSGKSYDGFSADTRTGNRIAIEGAHSLPEERDRRAL